MAQKLVVIVGITGNQGGSVATRFLRDPKYRIRGITRNPDSARAQSFASQGVEIVQADLGDPAALTRAFANANLIFTVTNFWESFFNPACRAIADEQRISYARYAYNVEYRQGCNMADAAAVTVETLDENGLIASTEGPAGKATEGRYGADGMCHFDAKNDAFPDYVKDKYPSLAAKMSCVWTAAFTLCWVYTPPFTYFGKVDQNTFVRRLTANPDAPIPHIDIVADMGNFVYAVSKMPPGKTYLAAGETCSWTEFMQTWGKVNGKAASYQQVTSEELITAFPDKAFGTEVATMNDMFSETGLDCGRKDLVTAEDIRKAGIDCPMTSLEESFRMTDWSPVLNQ